jgi:mono/diheme cytochrome c family protein
VAKERMRRYSCAFALALAVTGGMAWLSRVHVEAQPRGKGVYDVHCVECHGSSGKGDGPSAAFLLPRPRDFTTGKYKIRTTESGTMPTDEDLIASVRRGLYGTAMPGWDRILSDAEMTDVVQYIKSLSPRFQSEPAKRVPIADANPPSSPASVARGQQVYDKLQCGKCHGTDGRGTGAVTHTFEDEWRMPLHAADLTEPWTFHGGATSRDIYLRFRTGMTGTPMPSFADAATDAELWELANYVVSRARKPVWSMNSAEVEQFYARQQAQAKADPVNRGQQLVDTLGCAVCHSPFDAGKRMLPGMKLAGGMLVRIVPFGDFPTGNLTSDKDTGLGTWTNDEIKRAITKGILRDGSRLLPFPMDYGSYSTLTPGDLDAIVAYLRTVPAVSNKVPPPARPFLPFYLWGKFKMLILGDDPPMVFFAGNAGTKGATR